MAMLSGSINTIVDKGGIEVWGGIAISICFSIVLIRILFGTKIGIMAGIGTGIGIISMLMAIVGVGTMAVATVKDKTEAVGGFIGGTVGGIIFMTQSIDWVMNVAEIRATDVAVIMSEIWIISLISITAYISWCTYHEKPQFSLLRKVGITTATLFGTNFQAANLTNATFSTVSLKYTCFTNAILTHTCWQTAKHLKFARLTQTILDDKEIRELLVSGDGQNQSFRGKNLHGAYLVGAKLQNSDLRETKLIQTDLSQSNITGAKLYGSSRESWIIDGIICDYVYLDVEGKERTPKDRNFEQGEFEDLYKQLPEFMYYFEHGFSPLDAVVMDRVVQTINEQYPEFDLKLKNFEATGTPHATFTIFRKESIAEAEKQVSTIYERRIIELEAQKSQLMDVIKMLGSGNVALQPLPSGGMAIQSGLSQDLTQQVIEFFSSLPGLEKEDARRAWLYKSGLDNHILQQIQVGGASIQFFPLLVDVLVKHGTLSTGEFALNALLRASQDMVGVNRQKVCKELILQVRKELIGQ